MGSSFVFLEHMIIPEQCLELWILQFFVTEWKWNYPVRCQNGWHNTTQKPSKFPNQLKMSRVLCFHLKCGRNQHKAMQFKLNSSPFRTAEVCVFGGPPTSYMITRACLMEFSSKMIPHFFILKEYRWLYSTKSFWFPCWNSIWIIILIFTLFDLFSAESSSRLLH